MPRSLKKGPYVEEKLLKKVEKTRHTSLGGEKEKARILKPGDAGFVMPRRKRP